MSEASLTRRMMGAAVWMLGARMFVRVSGLFSIVILARLLPPAEFGLVGLAVAFIAAFEAMSDMSLNSALVRHPAPERAHFDTVWTLSALRGAIIGGIALLCAAPLAAFYGEPRLEYVAMALAAQQAMLGLMNPGIANFQRDFTFGRDFTLLASRKVASVALCVGLALTIWPDYRALVAGTLASAFVALGASYALSPYRPRPSLAALGELFGFTKWMLASNLLLFIQRRCDTFIIGKTLGLGALGVHALAMELANLVATEFALPLQRAFMPGFAKLLDDRAALRTQFLGAYMAAMTLAIPFAVGIAAVAGPLILLAFGTAWIAAIAPLKVLVFYGLMRASGVFCWPVIVAAGEPRRLAPLQLVSILFGVPAIWIASQAGGLTGAAWAMVAMAALYAVLVLRSALSMIGADAGALLAWLPRVLASALLMALAVRWGLSVLPVDASSLLLAGALLASGIGGASVYAVALFLLWRLAGSPDGAEARLLRMVRRS